MGGGKLVRCVVSTRPRVKLQETSFNDLLMTANATHSSTVGTLLCKHVHWYTECLTVPTFMYTVNICKDQLYCRCCLQKMSETRSIEI